MTEKKWMPLIENNPDDEELTKRAFRRSNMLRLNAPPVLKGEGK